MRSATLATRSCSARRRSVASGISRISRAMAVCVRSCWIMGQPVDDRSQIALVFEQRLNGFGLFPAQTKQHGNLDVAVGALNEFGGIILVASTDWADVDSAPRKKFCVPWAKVTHQTP